jgi:hypothetical protein
MMMESSQRITERVTRNGHPDDDGTPTLLLTLAEFFDGNDVEGSIGCNLHPIPSPGEFANWFPERFRPDEVWEGWRDQVSYEAYEIPPGTRPVACWWD